MDVQDSFDRFARRMRRQRVYLSSPDDRWLNQRIASELLERWSDHQTIAGPILIIGDDCGVIGGAMTAPVIHADGAAPQSLESLQVLCDEDRLPFADDSLAAIFSVGMLDTVNDVPGSLILARRCLKPGGIFLGGFLGAGSGRMLRSIVQNEERSIMRLRMHPQIDVRAAGDLLARAGFANCVADMETIEARYSTFDRLTADIRANGASNTLSSRAVLARRELAGWRDLFEKQKASDGKASESFCPIYMTGHSPASAQRA